MSYAISTVFMSVDMYWNYSHSCKVDLPKKWFYKIFLEHTQGICLGGFS